MIETETIAGTVKSNNGTEALVSFADGAEKLFKRTLQSETQFLADFPVGGTAGAKRLACDISTRQGIFAPLKIYLATGESIAAWGWSKEATLLLWESS